MHSWVEEIRSRFCSCFYVLGETRATENKIKQKRAITYAQIEVGSNLASGVVERQADALKHDAEKLKEGLA
ncbi:hypothetical protein SUGI_0931410 [Cryptomeria japonica]|nr:hypothetical protein SUGI_0931410 [Cryptomeria japonica]